MNKFPTTQRQMVRALIAAGGCALLWGCDQRSENAKAIEAAGRDLRSAGAIVGADGAGVNDAGLRAAAARVQEASTSGSDSEKGSASLILSQTMAAQGEAGIAMAKDLELKARNLAMRIISASGAWTQHNAVAAAADALDVSRDLSAMSASRSEKEKELGIERARLEQIKRELEELTAASRAKLAAADAKTTEYATLVQSAAKLTATESASVHERAGVLRREGDALRADGLKIQASADEKSPLVPEITLIIDKLQKQITNLDETAANLRRRSESAKAESAAAREAAEEVASKIDKDVVQLTTLRDSEISPAYEAALRRLREAASTANAAASAMPGGGKVAGGGAQLAVAEALWARGSGARAYAWTLDSLAAATPKLPNADDYRNKAASARKEAEDSIKAATEAFESARSAIESGGNRSTGAEVKARLAKLGEDIEKKAKNVTDGIWLDLQAPPPPAGDSESRPATTAAGEGGVAVPDDLRAFLAEYVNAVKNRDTDKVAQWTHTSDPALKDVVVMLGGFQKAMFTADAACQSKFNQPIDQVMASNPMLGMMFQQLAGAKASLTVFDTLSIADLPIVMQGPDKAIVTLPASPMPVEFVRINGAWMQGLGSQEAALKMAAPMMKGLAPLQAVMEAWAADVNAGKFADAQSAAADFAAKAMPAMQRMMPGGGG
ncbi:MAG: hypothetical protein JNK25_04145 [Phycisphaerae bacterium]|nr:hypothetical protein [Phycisphaerae bacterium]